MRYELARQGRAGRVRNNLRFPRPGLPVLAECLRGAILWPIRHLPLSDGRCESASSDVGISIWDRNTLQDARLVARSITARLGVGARHQQGPRRWLTRLRIPFAADVDSLGELPLSSSLLDYLDENDLLDPHKLSAWTAIRLLHILAIRPRHLMELLAVLESIGAMNVPSDAPADFPGLKNFEPPSAARAVLDRIEQRLGARDVGPTDARFSTLLGELPTGVGSLKKAILVLRRGIRSAGNRDPWMRVPGTLEAIDERLLEIYAATLEEDLKDAIAALLGGWRQVERVALRLGWLDGRPRTLREAAEASGITSDVIRRHERTVRIRMERVTLFCPRLIEAVQIVTAMAPCAGAAAAKALQARGLTQNEWTMHALLEAVRVMKVHHKFVILEGAGGEIMVSRTNRALHELASQLEKKGSAN